MQFQIVTVLFAAYAAIANAAAPVSISPREEIHQQLLIFRSDYPVH